MHEPRGSTDFAKMIESHSHEEDAVTRLDAYTHLERDVLPVALEELRTSIEELRIAEARLRLSRDERIQLGQTADTHRLRYQQLFELAPDALVITDRHGAIRELNAAARRLLRLPPETKAGHALVRFVRPSKKGIFKECLLAVDQTKRTQVFSIDLATPDGVPITAAVCVSQIDSESGSLHWTIKNDDSTRVFVDQREPMRDAPIVSKELIRVLERISDAFFALDGDLQIIYVNGPAESLCKRSRTDLIGLSFVDIAPIGLAREPVEKIQFAAKQHRQVEFETFVPDIGSWMEVRAFPTGGGVTIYCHSVGH